MWEPNEAEGEDREEEGRKEERRRRRCRVSETAGAIYQITSQQQGGPGSRAHSDKSAQKGTELKAKARERKKTEFDVKCICLRKWRCATWGVPQRLWDAVSLSHLAKTAIGQSAGEKGRAG